jgi:valacyclovir hydrolase
MFPYKRIALPDAVPLAYVDEGTGPLIVMLHGFTGTAHRHFSRMISEYSTDHRVVVPDFRGYGASRPPLRDFPPNFIERDADDVAYLMDHLRSPQAIVFGFSDGGESALILAARRPDLVRALVVWGTVGQASPGDLEFFAQLPPVDNWGPDLAPWRESIIEHHGKEQWPHLITARAEVARLMVATRWNASLQHAQLIKCPVLQIHGEIEERKCRAQVSQLASAIHDCHVEILLGGDHSLQLENPEELSLLIRPFIKRIDASREKGGLTIR